MMQRFEDKVVLVTGGGNGIGRASVLRFAEEGANVAIADINQEAAQQVVNEVETLGQQAIAIPTNVAEPADCEQMVAATVDMFGRLDVLFCNAGIGGSNVHLVDLDIVEWDRLMNINLRGMFLTCKFAVPIMRKSGSGAIVLMGSSTGGWDTLFGSGAYMASKEAVNALARNLALELGGYGIRVNSICPGIIQTQLSYKQGTENLDAWEKFFARFANRIPLRRVGQPEDVAATVAFLASEDARHITGSSLLIDGGQTLQSWSNAPESDAFPLFTEPDFQKSRGLSK